MSTADTILQRIEQAQLILTRLQEKIRTEGGGTSDLHRQLAELERVIAELGEEHRNFRKPG